MYDDIPNSDNLNPSTLSVCSDCAKDKSLKHFVIDQTDGNALCGICLSPHSADRTCALEHKDDLTNLMKALIRFHFDEPDYNPHWGREDHPYMLLCQANPIVHHEKTLFHNRSADWSGAFIEDLVDATPYPDPDKGISIYAGFDGGGSRMLHQAISLGQSIAYSSLRQRLLKENHFNVEPSVQDYMAKTLSIVGLKCSSGVPLFAPSYDRYEFIRQRALKR